MSLEWTGVFSPEVQDSHIKYKRICADRAANFIIQAHRGQGTSNWPKTWSSES